MKRKIFGISLLLVALMLIVSLVSCGGDNTLPSTPPTQSTPSTDSSVPSTDSSTPSTDSSTPSTDSVTITFDTSRAHGGLVVAPQTVNKGGLVTEPSETPYRRDFVFYGWCVDGDKTQKWDFATGVAEKDITLVAVFDRSTGDVTECKHNYEVTEYVAPTCTTNGKRVEVCSLCKDRQSYSHVTDETLKKLGHKLTTERVEPDCAHDGYIYTYCANGCGTLDTTETLRATGKHEYDINGWHAAIKPTKYVGGTGENNCIHCGGATMTMNASYTATKDQLNAPEVDISYLYTGGEYVDVKLVNVAKFGRVIATSYFDGTKPSYIIDGNNKTFWSADTYVDGAIFTDDWIEVELAASYDVGALKFTLPNYPAWELGDDCYASFDIEYWDETAQEWVLLGEISDKNARAVGMNCEFLMELDSPINTNKVRAKATHATRYAPATIYELEVFAKVNETVRTPLSISGQASVTVSGKYNDWSSGGASLIDGTTATYWSTDARYNPNPWALVEFVQDTYVACIQLAVRSNEGRAIKVECYSNGEWVDCGTFTVPGEGEEDESVVSNQNGICTFNMDLETKLSKIKLSIVKEPVYWESYIYELSIYTVVENAYNEPVNKECSHKNPMADTVVPASCGSIGYTEMKCTCGAVMRSKSTDATGHDFGKYTIEIPATATTVGTKVSTCRNEGCKVTNIISYEENYNNPVVTPYLHDAPAAWAQTFDDGNYLSTYEWANEQLSKYGYRATVVMSITYTDSLVDTWRDYFSRGAFDLGSHSYNHTSAYAAGANPNSLLGEVVNAQYWFRHNYPGQALLGFAAPLGTTSVSVAEYLTGPLAANRNGGDTGVFYNLLSNLNARKVWGDLNSYISKFDQTEGVYVYLNTKGGTFQKIIVETDTGEVDADGNPIIKSDISYEWKDKGSYDSAGVFLDNNNGEYAILQNPYGEYVMVKKATNYVFIESRMTFVDISTLAEEEKNAYKDCTYKYVSEDYRYDFLEMGSYNFNGTGYDFVEDNSGNFKLIKATIGSYEKGVEKLVEVGGFTVECIHELREPRVSQPGGIHSSFVSTISKFEHIKRFGIWAGSYNDLIKYFKESQSVSIETIERTDSSITLSVTDNLDDFMFDHALTIKVDIPDSWTSVTATQNGKDIPLVSNSVYSASANMATVSCTIKEGFLYVDVVPDRGNVVITMGEKNENPDYQDRVTVTYNPFDGVLESLEYETIVVKGETIKFHPTPEKFGHYFKGWFFDEECTQSVDKEYAFTENVTLYARWEEMPKCTDGTYTHNWGIWFPIGDGMQEHTCKKCGAIEREEIPN